MTSIQAHIQQQERQQAQRLKSNIKRLICDQLHSISPWWLISFHYRDHHSKEDELLKDVADLKRKLHRIIYKNRDKSIKGAGEYPYPRMLFLHETSHQGTGQFHTHLIAEQFPASLNSQVGMETLFHRGLPDKVMALSKWKSIDVQRINQDDDDCRRISNYLVKQTSLGVWSALRLTHSVVTYQQERNEKKPTHHYLPRRRRTAAPPGTAPAKKKPASQYVGILSCSDCGKVRASGGSQMKTVTIRLPDVEAAMLVEVQKVNKVYRNLQLLLVTQIRQEHEKLR